MSDTRNSLFLAFITLELDKIASLLDLTPRKTEILQSILTGRTNKAMATQFWITEKTVEFHLDRIYTKIGMRTRVMASGCAMQQ